VGSNQTYRVQEENARIQENGRYALEIIGRSLRQAGYQNVFIATTSPWPGTPITGENGASGAADKILTMSDWNTGDVSCDGDTVGTAGQLVRDAFYLNTTTSELLCDGIIHAAPAVIWDKGRAIIDNIEDLQVLYGIDTNADHSVDKYAALPTASEWAGVISAKICVVVRSANNGVSVGRQSYFNCAGALGTVSGSARFTLAAVGDTRLHRAFVSTFTLRNRINNQP
jgi:type IV pilus assembly protein PilW